MNKNNGLKPQIPPLAGQILVFLFIVLFQTIVLAGLSVDPAILEVVAKKDSETKGSFKVLNTGAIPIHIRVSPEKWQGANINVEKWVSLAPMEMKLGQNEQKEVSYRIVPLADSSGELRCMVFFIADEMGEQKSNVGIRFGVPIYAVVGGTEIIDAEIKNIELTYDYGNKVINGTILVNNKSNIHIRPHIEITIFDSRNKPITKFSPPYGQPAQANQNRPLMFQQNLALDIGKYKLVAKVDYGKMYGLADKIAEKKKAFRVKMPMREVNEVKKDEAKK